MFGLETILRLLAPYDCLRCGQEGGLICNSCLPAAIKPLPERCFRCRTTGVKRGICAGCQAQTDLNRIWIASAYAGLPRRLIKQYKFDRAKDASAVLAAFLAKKLPDPGPTWIITYIPTATSRIRERGYDHAKQLAANYAALQGRKISHLLARSGQARQVGASRARRLSQLETAFRMRRRADVAGKDILLIDDVVTTGATLQTAAGLLKAHGARSVSALVVAQKE